MQYIVVLDAGSSGTRVYVYGFTTRTPSTVLLVSDVSQKTSPGLSAYASNASAAADSIQPLILRAISTVPVSQQSSTPIFLGATGESNVTVPLRRNV